VRRKFFKLIFFPKFMTSSKDYQEAVSIIRFLSISSNEGNIAQIDKGMSSQRLLELAEKFEDFISPQLEGEIYEEPRDIHSQLRMYGNYLRDLNEPEFVLGDALLELSPIRQEPGYYIPWEFHPIRNKFSNARDRIRKGLLGNLISFLFNNRFQAY
jgi:hypothetical protein